MTSTQKKFSSITIVSPKQDETRQHINDHHFGLKDVFTAISLQMGNDFIAWWKQVRSGENLTQTFAGEGMIGGINTCQENDLLQKNGYLSVDFGDGTIILITLEMGLRPRGNEIPYLVSATWKVTVKQLSQDRNSPKTKAFVQWLLNVPQQYRNYK